MLKQDCVSLLVVWETHIDLGCYIHLVQVCFHSTCCQTNQTTKPFKSPHSPPHLWRRCVKNHCRGREERKRNLAYLVVNAAQFAARVSVVVFGRTGLRCGWPLASALTCSGLRPALALVLMVASGGKYLLSGRNLRWNSWFCCSKLLKERWRVMAHRRLVFHQFISFPARLY